jgi:phospho-N-acetylmuramoyl-pentapeptide-transferase
MIIADAARILMPSALAFSIGIAFAPLLASILYKNHAWKKKGGKGEGLGGGGTPLFDALHKERETSTPRMGGIVIWFSVLGTALLLFLVGLVSDSSLETLDFVNRSQTWLPLAALAVGACIGFFDDLIEITKGGGGLRLRHRLLMVGLLGLGAGWWFYEKLDVTSVGVPFGAPLEIGWLVIPLFAAVTLALYAGGTIDGIDGLAGGVFAIIFMTYAGIASVQGQVALAAFSAAVAGATLAFLWFNIPPARFYMSETGSMALTLALATIAFTADALGDGIGLAVLPLIALPLTVTVTTTLLQVVWKRCFGKKLFAIAPIHHHFESLGWPAYKVTMRYWVITIIAGVFGLTLALLGGAP